MERNGTKGNIHKKETFEDKFSRHYACWVKNHPEKWAIEKRRNRKLFRKKMKKQLQEEGLEEKEDV